MTDRITGVLGVIFAVVYGVTGAGFSSSLSADPLGPNAFPILLALLLAPFSLVLALKPGDTEAPTTFAAGLRAAIAVLVMVVYGFVLEYLGFVFASFLLVLALVQLMGGSWKQGGLFAAIGSVVLYFFFDRMFGLPLPTGAVFTDLGLL